MNLTREEAIEEHRKMWNWIADKLLSNDIDKYHESNIIKKDYLNQKYGEDNYRLEANCFLCEYVYKNIHKTCSFCPLDWGEIACFHIIYSDFFKTLQEGHNKEAAAIARQIANLPEKKEGKK